MKKTLLLFLTLFAAVATYAERHMEFMEVSLGQSVDSFAVAMQQKGFRPYTENKIIPRGNRYMVGTFNNTPVKLNILYGLHTNQVTSVRLTFAEIKELGEFLPFYEAMKQAVTEQYCSEGEVVNEPGDMKTLPKYGMTMDYGSVVLQIDPNTAFTLSVIYTDTYNTMEERKKRYD